MVVVDVCGLKCLSGCCVRSVVNVGGLECLSGCCVGGRRRRRGWSGCREGIICGAPSCVCLAGVSRRTDGRTGCTGADGRARARRADAGAASHAAGNDGHTCHTQTDAHRRVSACGASAGCDVSTDEHTRHR